jgi:diguanylate cyclase
MPHSATAEAPLRLLPPNACAAPAFHSVVRPWAGFALAAEAAVRDLHTRFGWDLWAVERSDGDRRVDVAAAGPLATDGPPAASARDHEAVRIPLLSGDGEPLGWLRGLSRKPQPSAAEAARAAATLLGGMLATIAAAERAAADRAAEAAAAYALATRDGLTGLLNRRGWQDALNAEEQRARRYGRAVSALVIDLDGLKQLNDTDGHRAGDAALTACAKVLAGFCRPGDAVARIGGDEFAVLAIECDVVSARALTVRLREAMRTAGVRASVGAATRRVGEELGTTVQRADQAMYQLKRRRTPAVSPAPSGRPRPYGAAVRARAELLPA